MLGFVIGSLPGRLSTVDAVQDKVDVVLCSAAKRLKGHQRRLFMAEATDALCGGHARQAEARFGWGRETVKKGQHELKQGMRCLEHFAGRARQRWEEKQPQLAQDIRAIVEPRTQADPELHSPRRYANVSANDVLEELVAKGYRATDLPKERTMRNILNRMNYRLQRIQKAKPLQKTKDTDAIFANVAAVKAEAKADAATVEISMDTKAQVNEGDYARGGKNPDQRAGRNAEGLGPRPAGQTKVDAAGHLGVGDGGADADLRVEGNE